MSKQEAWNIVKIGALLGAGFEFATTIMWQAADMIRSILNMPIG